MSSTKNSILIKHLTPRNFLSFGPDSSGLELQSLNLLIGPNGSGKSNLIEAINFMRAAPKELRDVTRKGGGVQEWIWKGFPDKPACVDWVVNYPQGKMPLRHTLSFHAIAQSFAVDDETVEDAFLHPTDPNTQSYYRFSHGKPFLKNSDLALLIGLSAIDSVNSILAQRRDPDRFPELAWLAQNYEKIRIYREWSFGRSAVFREPQKADARNDVLAEDFSNLGLFLSRLMRTAKTKRMILDRLRDIYDGIHDLNISVEGGTVQVFFAEGDFSIPATRLSAGTLRYLCLLAILCDPEPPPLICIEEPELGLHPDILPKVADLLRGAATRTQLIVTTHSDILVDAMTETPEAVVVCSKQDGKTSMERLSKDTLKTWLQDYRLGELWTKGEIGGTRW